MQKPLEKLTPAQIELVESCQGLVRNLAWKMHIRLGRRVELDDLISYGQLGLIDAAQRFDETAGTKFVTFAYHRIRGALYDSLDKLDWFDRAAYEASRYEYLAAQTVQSAEHPPAHDSLDEHVRWFGGLSVRLAMVRLLTADEDDHGLVIEDRICPRPDEDFALQEERQTVRTFVDQLPERQRLLVKFAYFDGMSLTKAGEKIGVSKATASRLHDEAIKRLGFLLRAGMSDQDQVSRQQSQKR